MKLPKVAALLIITLSMFTTGCNTSSESPENLLNESIVYNESRKEIYGIVNKALEGKTMLLPQNSSEVGQINEVNDDLVVFQQEDDINDNSSRVGFVLISKENENYIVKDSLLEEGDNIEYATFYDINNDGNKEVILLINDDSTTTMKVYSIKDDKITKISEVKPTWLKNYKKFTTMKIKIGSISNDAQIEVAKNSSKVDIFSKVDILMLNGDNSGSDIYATILNYTEDNKVEVSNSVKIGNVKNLQDSYINMGNIYTNKKGIVLNLPTLKENAYATQLLYLDKGKLKKVFQNDNFIMNTYYVPVKDINNDGVLEIPVLNNRMLEVYTANSKVSSLVNWRKWNGKTGKNADTVFMSQIYYNYKNNFKFLVPNNLANKLYIKKNLIGSIPCYGFYCYDDGSKKPVELFSIGIVEKSLTEETKSTTQVEAILYETAKESYQLFISDKDSFEKHNLTVDTVKDYFSMIYK